MRTLNFERAEIVLLPESVFADLEREIIAPRAKIVAGIPDDMEPDQIVAFTEALTLLRWGAKIQEGATDGTAS